jgi:hypothetical protein
MVAEEDEFTFVKPKGCVPSHAGFESVRSMTAGQCEISDGAPISEPDKNVMLAQSSKLLSYSVSERRKPSKFGRCAGLIGEAARER